jgi:hypothetical protein
MTHPIEQLRWSARLLMVAGGILLAAVQPAAAQTGTFTATGKVTALLAETKMRLADKAGHELNMVRRLDTLSYSDPVLGSGQAIVLSTNDVIAGSGTNRGYFEIAHPTGDKTFTSFEGTVTATPKPGGPPEVTFEGKWSYVGGTGKFTGITGGGTYKGGLTPAGPAYEFGGRYTLKQ